MADRPATRSRPSLPAVVERERHGIVTAAAQQLLGLSTETYAQQYKSWQDELWDYSRSIGEYGGVMDWFAAGISRMHLTAAIVKPGPLREPVALEEGPAVDLMQELVAGANGGETQYLYKWGRHVGVPGVGYFIGYDDPRDGLRKFDVKSAKQIRRSNTPYVDPRTRKIIKDPRTGETVTGFDVQTGPNDWFQLPIESLVGRIFRPDDELDFQPTSWSRAALTTLREIDLLNRHVVAQLLSRLVFNGFLLIPEEVTFPANPQFKDAPDPFIAELIAVGQAAIRDPGSAGSAMPVPLRIPAQFIDKIIHLPIANALDAKTIEARAAAVTRLSKQLPAPPSAMEGNQDSNHWNAWKDSEDNVKLYFGPTMEVLCGGFTDIYLRPMLQAGGHPLEQDGGRIVVWYDASDLINKPDNSENAKDAHANATISDDAYLTALGMDRDDKASKKERRERILITLAQQGLPIPDSFYLLYPEDKPAPGMDQLGNPLPTMQPPGSATGGPAPNAGPSGGKTNGRPVAGQAQTKPGAPVGGPPAANGRAKAPSAPRGG